MAFTSALQSLVSPAESARRLREQDPWQRVPRRLVPGLRQRRASRSATTGEDVAPPQKKLRTRGRIGLVVVALGAGTAYLGVSLSAALWVVGAVIVAIGITLVFTGMAER